MFSPLTPTVTRRSRKNAKHTDKEMDMESIRARRAKLEDIISTMRLPPLTRSSSMSQPSLFKGIPTTSLKTAWLARRRRSLEGPSRASLTPSTSRRSPDITTMPLTPMTCRPFIQPLPDIRRKGSLSLLPTPSVSRQVSGKRRSAPPSATSEGNRRQTPYPFPEEKRPATARSQDSLAVALQDDDTDEGIPCGDSDVADIVRGMGSNSKDKSLSNTIKARKLLSKEEDPPIKEFLKAGILTPLIPLLQDNTNTTLQFEATWTLTNLASGTTEQTATVVDSGAIPILVSLLKSDAVNVKEQSAWALGNISGDGVYYRNLVVQAGVITPLLDTLQVKAKGITAQPSLVKVVTWVLANVFRHKGITMPPQERNSCITVLKMLLLYDDSEVNVDALWAVSYVADMDDDSLGEVVSAGLVPPLVNHLKSDVRQKVVPALRAIGNIAAGDDVQTDTVLDNQVLPILRPLLEDSRRNLRKEATWTVSNITAGNRSQIQRVIDANILPLLVKGVHSGYLDIQKEATWAISNLTSGGSEEQMAKLIDANAVPALVEMLSIGESNIIIVALQALHNLLQVKGKEEEVKDTISGEGGIQKLQVLQQYVDPSISEKAQEILEVVAGNSDE